MPASLLPSFPPSLLPIESRLPLVDAIARLASGASFGIVARDLSGLDASRAILPRGASLFITWLPTDSDDTRVAAAKAIRAAGFEPVPHIAARSIRDRRGAEALVGRFAAEAGVTQIFLVGGDVETPSGDYGSALEFLGRVRLAAHGICRVGLAGHTEGVPAVPRERLEQELETKIAVCEDADLEPFVVTQFAFDAAPIVAWIERLRARGIATPVRVGLAGPASIRTLLRYARLCGVGASAKGLSSKGASIARMLFDTGPDPVIRVLAEMGVQEELGPVSLHLFPFGGLARTAAWIDAVAHGRLRMRNYESGFEAQVRVNG